MTETEMLWKLRQLPREMEPGRDLWPAIAAATVQPRRQRQRLRWLAPIALAASVLLTVGIVYRAQHATPGQAPAIATAPGVPAAASPVASHVVPTPGDGAPPVADAGTPTARVTVATARRAAPVDTVPAPPPATPAGDAGAVIARAIVSRETEAVSAEYRTALSQFEGAAMSADVAPALQDLDRSVAQIRRAMAADPGSVFLLDQLRRTYELRLSLTQRAVLG